MWLHSKPRKQNINKLLSHFFPSPTHARSTVLLHASNAPLTTASPSIDVASRLPSCSYCRALRPSSHRQFSQSDRGSPTLRHRLRRRRRGFIHATTGDLRTLLCPGVAPEVGHRPSPSRWPKSSPSLYLNLPIFAPPQAAVIEVASLPADWRRPTSHVVPESHWRPTRAAATPACCIRLWPRVNPGQWLAAIPGAWPDFQWTNLHHQQGSCRSKPTNDQCQRGEWNFIYKKYNSVLTEKWLA